MILLVSQQYGQASKPQPLARVAKTADKASQGFSLSRALKIIFFLKAILDNLFLDQVQSNWRTKERMRREKEGKKDRDTQRDRHRKWETYKEIYTETEI